MRSVLKLTEDVERQSFGSSHRRKIEIFPFFPIRHHRVSVGCSYFCHVLANWKTPLSGSSEKLFFDVRTGLLLRRYMEAERCSACFRYKPLTKTIEKLTASKPFLIRWSMPGRSWGRKIVEMKQNVDI